jgi:AAA+ ATPase superfamily predicted ATPase
MNNKQEEAIQLAKDGHSFFLTGGIGTGKTRCIQHIVNDLRRNDVCVAVTASTGLASKQITGTTTCLKGQINVVICLSSDPYSKCVSHLKIFSTSVEGDCIKLC